MGVDVNKANTQAAQLQEYANQLRNAKKNLESYRKELSLNWIGKETQYVFSGINSAIYKIDAVIKELESVQSVVKTTASQIKQEEIAKAEAERKAREEAERKAREEAARKAEAERRAREEAERKAKEEAEKRAREEAERKAAEEKEKKKKTTTKKKFLFW